MIYIIYGSEPYMIRAQKAYFKGQAECEFGYEEFSDLPGAQNFLSGISLFTEKLYAYTEVDTITELTKKDFLSYVEEMKERKDKNLLIYLRKVKSDAKGLDKLREKGCFLQEYSKISRYVDLKAYVFDMAQKIGASFTSEAMDLFLARMDYLENESVNMITLENQIGQLKYLGEVIDTSDILENVPDLREGKKFALAGMISRKEVKKIKQEVIRLERDREFSGMGLMGLLHREYRIGYLLKSAECSLSEQKVRFCNVTSLTKDELAGGLQIISECMQDVKNGIYTDVEGFELCVTRLIMGEAV